MQNERNNTVQCYEVQSGEDMDITYFFRDEMLALRQTVIDGAVQVKKTSVYLSETEYVRLKNGYAVLG